MILNEKPNGLRYSPKGDVWQWGGRGLCLPAPCRRHRWEQKKLKVRKCLREVVTHFV